jgi:hypothetical protein
MESGGWTEGVFIVLGGSQAHDNSGWDDKFNALSVLVGRFLS